MKMMKISPSVLACDFTRLGDEVLAMRDAGAEMIHLDVMDGHFVPNISFGPPVIASLKKRASIFFDTHLMISEPLRYVGSFADAGADMITFHIESDSDPAETIAAVKARNLKCGLVLKPQTPAAAVRKYLPDIDMVLVMTVEPGFGGQKFMADMLPKIAELRAFADECNPGLDIQVDGGIDMETVIPCAKAGANVFVAGSSLFSAPDYAAAVDALRKTAENAV